MDTMVFGHDADEGTRVVLSRSIRPLSVLDDSITVSLSHRLPPVARAGHLSIQRFYDEKRSSQTIRNLHAQIQDLKLAESRSRIELHEQIRQLKAENWELRRSQVLVQDAVQINEGATFVRCIKTFGAMLLGMVFVNGLNGSSLYVMLALVGLVGGLGPAWLCMFEGLRRGKSLMPSVSCIMTAIVLLYEITIMMTAVLRTGLK